MAAALAALVVLPILADAPLADVVTLEAVGSAEATGDGDLKWISTDPDANPPVGSANPGEGNMILVIVHDEEASNASTLTRTVDIETSAGSAEISVDLSAVSTHYEGTFRVVTAATNDDADVIRGRHAGKITISYVPFDVSVNPFTQTIEIKVDEDGPEVDGLVPDDKDFIDDEDVTFRADAVDEESGIGENEEAAGSASPLGLGTLIITWKKAASTTDKVIKVDTDEDGILDSVAFDPGHAGTPILNQNINIPANLLDAIEDADEDVIGFSLGATLPVGANARFFWQLVATDLAGNRTFSDINRFDVDDKDPVISENDSETGIKYDSVKEKEKDARDWIRIQFNSGSAGGTADTIDESTVPEADFLVDGVQPKEVVVVEDEGRIYLKLNDDLAPDAEPEVSLVGTIRDLAGNAADLNSIDPPDGIAPELNVTLGGQPSGKILVSLDEITINITSDEATTAAPDVLIFLVRVSSSTDDGEFTVAQTSGPAVTIDGSDLEETSEDTAWTVDVDLKDDLGNVEGLYVISVVSANDETGNEGTFGPEAGDEVDVDEDDDVFFEVDLFLNDADEDIITLPDASNDDGDETDSTSPVIKIEFGKESKEYTATAEGLEDDIKVDTHKGVDLIKVEFGPKGDTEDVTDQVARSGKNEFFYRPFGLDEDTVYEMVVTAVDEVGNVSTSSAGEDDEDDATEFEFEFTVVEREAYEVGLAPGWNLISLPGTPIEPGLDDVLPDDLEASRILQWVNGAFEVNERQSDGTWDPSGGVTEMVAGPGYWVFSTVFEDIETLLSLRDPADVLPTVEIVGGWNLIGVVDINENDAGTGPGAGENEDADDYLASIEGWLIAYSYNAETLQWTRIVPGTDSSENAIFNGKGYWVWAGESGTLVP